MFQFFWKKINSRQAVKKRPRIFTRDEFSVISREFQIRDIMKKNELINERANFNKNIWKKMTLKK
jgi:hypothetical protein